MVFKLEIHSEMTLNQIATEIADTIPRKVIIEVTDNLLAGKFIPIHASDSTDPWSAILSQIANKHLIEHEFMPVKTIINIMVNHFIDNYKELCPSAPIGALAYLIEDGEITKSYSMLTWEISCVLQERYKTPESITTIRGQAA